MKGKQSGFTLIEMAIVLVIIGLLLGGVLKGQELINSAKVKNLATDFKNIPIFIYGYQDKFRALPGDDPNAQNHVGSASITVDTCAAATNKCALGNGLIDGQWNDPAGSESFLFWQQVRLANLTTGPTLTTASDYIPTNTNGGILGVQSNVNFTSITMNAAGTLSPMVGTYIVCSQGILGKYVVQLDTQMDDGNPDTGSMRAFATSTPGTSVTAATVNADQGGSYTVCMSI